ncbi:MAG: hypothetical protein AB1634_05810 [Thermodesulfobacteriota bacterium]
MDYCLAVARQSGASEQELVEVTAIAMATGSFKTKLAFERLAGAAASGPPATTPPRPAVPVTPAAGIT